MNDCHFCYDIITVAMVINSIKDKHIITAGDQPTFCGGKSAHTKNFGDLQFVSMVVNKFWPVNDGDFVWFASAFTWIHMFSTNNNNNSTKCHYRCYGFYSCCGCFCVHGNGWKASINAVRRVIWFWLNVRF